MICRQSCNTRSNSGTVSFYVASWLFTFLLDFKQEQYDQSAHLRTADGVEQDGGRLGQDHMAVVGVGQAAASQKQADEVRGLVYFGLREFRAQIGVHPFAHDREIGLCSTLPSVCSLVQHPADCLAFRPCFPLICIQYKRNVQQDEGMSS